MGGTAAKSTTNLVAGKTGQEDFVDMPPFLVGRNAVFAECKWAGIRINTSSSIQAELDGGAATRGLKHRRDYGLRHFSHRITGQLVQHEQP